MQKESFVVEFSNRFKSQPFRLIASQTGWQRRSGKIDPFEFLNSAIFSQASASAMSLDSQGRGFSDVVSRQAIDQRYTPAAVDFFRASFSHILNETLQWTPDQPQAQALSEHFKAVYFLDSTSFDSTESLKQIFPSCGGNASSANVKLLVRYNLISGALEPLEMLPGRRADQGLALRTAERLKADELQTNDKGFFASTAWRAAQQNGAFLLSPLPHSTTLWLKDDEGEPLEVDLAAELAHSSQNRVEWDQVWVGKQERQVGPLRVVAFKLSTESASRRRAALRESCRRQGRTPTTKALELAGWLILVTNAPATKLPSAVMSYFYRARWQIELIFRQLKSVLRIDKRRSDNPYRVQCEIWARLMLGILLFLWHAHANAQSWATRRQEISFEKFFNLVQHWGHSLARAFLKGVQTLQDELRTIWRHALVNARKGRQKSRTNTWDLLTKTWLQPQPE